ncbi:LysR family transcriptional regulator [Propionispira raffinosivorans]|uniref:LysR family transcriptional regulator n=1 Tax=Propionispira raffinosivorans TaxID=86959 RepID=UPI000360CABA|nr:LysR family transcriptional regulator [Propionispira raffinosivorans]
MELKQLEYFLTVSKLKSFTLAAEQMYVSQPGVTTAIKRLEEELGIQLFIRNKKNATLTAEGRVFFNHIEIIMNDVSKAITSVTELKNLNNGNIRIGLSPVTGVSVLTFILAKFHALYPSLSLIFIEDGSLQLQKQLEEGLIDFAIISISGKDSLDMLEIHPLGQQEFRIALPTYHMFKDKKQLKLINLANENLILFKENCLSRKILLDMFHRSEIEPIISFSSNSVQTIKRFIVCGSGISLLPAEALEDDKSICSLTIDPPLYIPFGLAIKKSNHLSHAAETLIEFIKNALSNE